MNTLLIKKLAKKWPQRSSLSAFALFRLFLLYALASFLTIQVLSFGVLILLTDVHQINILGIEATKTNNAITVSVSWVLLLGLALLPAVATFFVKYRAKKLS